MTSQSLTIDPAIAPYIECVEARLADLPETERADLAVDLAAHLGEVLSEGTADDLREAIGTPEEYANEFVSTIGVESDPHRRASLRAVVSGWMERLRGDSGSEGWVRRWLTEMTPAWWALRGLAIGLFVAWDLLQVGVQSSTGVDRLVGVSIVVAAVTASMYAGNRRNRGSWWRWAGRRRP